MLFLSNFGSKISVNFWRQQDSNSVSVKEALVTSPLNLVPRALLPGSKARGRGRGW